jgi:flagellar basal-body rod modification protein FlgD
MSTVTTTSSPTPSVSTTSLANTSSASDATSNSGWATQLPSATDFLQILVAEFQNQDPTQPTDPTEFASQLVQFADLGQLQQIDSAVQQSPSSGLMQAASAFIGRQVTAPGQSIGVQNGKATSIVYTPTTSGSYTAAVINSAGAKVATVSLGQQNGGTTQTFTWQPSSSIPDGQYSVSIVDSNGTALSGLAEQGVVQNVSLSSSGTVSLNLGNLSLSDSQISSISQAQGN